MYRYDEFDHAFVRERVADFRDQVERRLAGQLTEDEFRPFACATDSISSFTPTCSASPFPTACCRPANSVSSP